MWWSIGGGIIIFALGMFIFLKPGLIWKLTEEWKSYRADEPSEFYLKATKIGGALFAQASLNLNLSGLPSKASRATKLELLMASWFWKSLKG